MTSVRVSVVIPWGGKDIGFLEKQLESLSVQTTDEPFEVLLSCNSEIALSLFASLRNIPDNFRLIDSSHTPGVVYSRNRAAQYAEGDKLLFCDADDVVAGNWVHEMSSQLEIYDFVGSPVDYNALNSGSFNRRNNLAKAGLSTALNFLPYVAGCSQGYRRQIFDSVGGFSATARYTEDIDISWRLQLAGRTVGFASKTHIQYRLDKKFIPAFSKHFHYGIGFAELTKVYRDYGARQSWKSTMTDLAKCFGSLFLFLPSPIKRNKAGFICGFFLGRVVGSCKYKVKAF